MVTFKADKNQFLKTLKRVKVAVRGKGTKANSVSCEITVIDGRTSFSVPGALFLLDCITNGTCKATVPFLKFQDLIKSTNKSEIEVKISEGELEVGIVTIKANTIFFRDDSVLRTIDLPINYTDADLLRIAKENYTIEELKFNRLYDKIEQAQERFNKKLDKAYNMLKDYELPFPEFENLVEEHLYKKSDK